MGPAIKATRWPLYSLERDPVPVLQKDVCDAALVWRARKFLPPLGFDPLEVQPVVGRYQLRYPGPFTKVCLIYYTFSEIGIK